MSDTLESLSNKTVRDTYHNLGKDKTLLPCPFCGADSFYMHKILRDGCKPDEFEAFAYTVGCHGCAAEGGWAKSETGARRWWQTRYTIEK